MAQKQYSQEFKEQVIKECNDVANAALVARRHDISSNTIYGWISATKKRGSVKPLPRNEAKRLSEIEKRLESTSKENTTLKRLLGEKELELAVLRELRDTVNPQ